MPTLYSAAAFREPDRFPSGELVGGAYCGVNLTDDDVVKAMVQWLAARLGKTVIRAHQDGPRPALPYVMVNLTGSAPLRVHNQGVCYDPDAPNLPEPMPGQILPLVMARPIVDREWRFSVHAFGTNPTQVLRPLESASKLNQTLEPMFPDLTIEHVSQVRNVPEFVNNLWEPRANVDIYVHGVTLDGFEISVVGAIEPVDFDRRI